MNAFYNYPHWFYWPLSIFFSILAIVIFIVEGFSLDTTIVSTASLCFGLGSLMYTSIRTPWYAPLLIQSGMLLIFLEAFVRTKETHRPGPFLLIACAIGIVATIFQIIYIIREHKEKELQHTKTT